MTKSQKVLILVIGLLILGVALFTFFARNQPALQTFSATAHRDCAPWDGAAFTLAIPYESGMLIYVSIWRSPEFLFPTTFTFPDETGQLGTAYLLPEVDPLTLLRGQVTLKRVEEGMPLEGRFSFASEGGGRFEGQFHAEWDDQIIMCG
jgi:hypothetical protein